MKLGKNQTYYWAGLNNQGVKSTGELAAINQNYAKLILKKQGILVHAIRKKPWKFLKNTSKKITAFEIAVLFRQLATLIQSGIPIVQSFQILLQSQEKIFFKQLISSIKIDIESGKELASVLFKFPQYFDELTCHLVQVGEQTGALATMLKRIAVHHEKILYFKNKIKQALIYPTLVSLTAIIVSLIMLTCVVPHFAELFRTSQHALPKLTLAVMYLSELIRHYYWLILFPIFGWIILISYFKNNKQFIQLLDYFILKLIIIGPIFQKIALIRFAQNLSTTFAAGIPIAEALKIIAPTCGNQTYKKTIMELHHSIVKGQQLHRALQKNSLFPNMLVQMVQMGEESGMLEHMLEKIVEIYETELDHLVLTLSHLLEPLIMVILGVLIGGLVIALYLPIFKLGTVL